MEDLSELYGSITTLAVPPAALEDLPAKFTSETLEFLAGSGEMLQTTEALVGLSVEEIALWLGISASFVALLAAGKYVQANGLPLVRAWRNRRGFGAMLRDVEKVVNGLRRMDREGWRRVCEKDLRFRIDDAEHVNFDGEVVHMPVGLETKIAIHEGVTEFLKATTTTKLRRLLTAPYKYATDGFYSRHLVDKHLQEKVVTPVVGMPRNAPLGLIAHLEMVHLKGLGRVPLLENGDLNASLLGHHFDSRLAARAREAIDMLASQLATDQDGSKKLRDGRLISDVTGVMVFSYCEHSPEDVNTSDVARDVENALTNGTKPYILYPAALDHDSVREKLLSSWLWRDFHRDDWYEPGPPGIRKGRISFVPDRVELLVS